MQISMGTFIAIACQGEVGTGVENTVAPSHDYEGISPNVGDTATVTPGTWTGDPTLTYQWRRNGVDIGGETATTYTFVDADFGLTVDVIEIPNGNASAAAASAATGAVIGAPIAAFTYAHNATGSREITFTDTSTRTPTSWLWDFGDGNDSTDQNPAHTYAADGDYTVTLVATNAGGDSDPADEAISVVGYLFRDEFTTDEAAPLASPRTAEPGPGTLTLTQSDGQMSIVDEELIVPAQSTPAFGDLGFRSASLARQAGRVAIFDVIFTILTVNDSIVMGWTTATNLLTATIVDSALVSGSTLSPFAGKVSLNAGLAIDTPYKIAVVLRSSGSFLLLKGGAFTNWTLFWPKAVDNTTPLYVVLSSFNAAAKLPSVRVRQLPAPFQTDDGIASVNVSSPTSGASHTATADAITDVTFVLNGAPAANEVAVRLNYRVQDANNKWTAYIKRNAGNTAWDYLVDSVSGGTPTNRVTVTGVGTPTTLRAIYEGSLHDHYSLVTTTWTKQGSQISLSHLNTQTAINVEFAAGTTVSALKSYPRTSAAYAELDRERS